MCWKKLNPINYISAITYPLKETKSAKRALLKLSEHGGQSEKLSREYVLALEAEVERFRKGKGNKTRLLDLFLESLNLPLSPKSHADFYLQYAKVLSFNEKPQLAAIFYEEARRPDLVKIIEDQLDKDFSLKDIEVVKEFAKESATPTFIGRTSKNQKVVIKPDQKVSAFSPWGEGRTVHHTSDNELGAFLLAKKLKVKTPYMIRRENFRGKRVTIQSMIPKRFLNTDLDPTPNEFQLFDYLIGNMDRYKHGNPELKNYLLIQKLGGKFIHLHIDGGAAFAVPSILLHSNRFPSLSRFKFPIKRSEYERVKKLSAKTIDSSLNGVIPHERILEVHKRRDQLIDFIEKRIENYALDKTFSD